MAMAATYGGDGRQSRHLEVRGAMMDGMMGEKRWQYQLSHQQRRNNIIMK
jgi:hypothetical protein